MVQTADSVTRKHRVQRVVFGYLPGDFQQVTLYERKYVDLYKVRIVGEAMIEWIWGCDYSQFLWTKARWKIRVRLYAKDESPKLNICIREDTQLAAANPGEGQNSPSSNKNVKKPHFSLNFWASEQNKK